MSLRRSFSDVNYAEFEDRNVVDEDFIVAGKENVYEEARRGCSRLRAPTPECASYLAHLVHEGIIAPGPDALSLSHNNNYYYADILSDGSIRWGTEMFSLKNFLTTFFSPEDCTKLLPQVSRNGLLLQGLGLQALIRTKKAKPGILRVKYQKKKEILK